VERLWDLNPARHEDGAIGGLAKALFGWNDAPSAIELAGWAAYLGGAAGLWIARRIRRARG